MYQWLVIAGMVAAYFVISIIDADGQKTSFAIGLVGATSIVFRLAYGWWVYLHLKPEARERPYSRETQAWTGLMSTMARWLSMALWMTGWLILLALTILSFDLSDE
jgi:hypothetical protein